MAGVHVIGCGSIGLLVAWHLRHVEVPVTLLMRSAASARAVADAGGLALEYLGGDVRWMRAPSSTPRLHVGVELLQPDGAWRCVPMTAAGAAADALPTAAPITQLVVGTKAADTAGALRSVAGRLSPGAEVLLLQNGMLGLYAELHQALPSAQLRGGDAVSGASSGSSSNGDGATGGGSGGGSSAGTASDIASVGHDGRSSRCSAWLPPSASLFVGSVTHGAYRRTADVVVQSCTGRISVAPADQRLPDLADMRHAAAWGRLPPRLLLVTGAPCSGGGDNTPGNAAASTVASLDAVAASDAGRGSDTVWDTVWDASLAGGSLLERVLLTPGLAAELVPSHHALMQQLHRKLAVNCAVNPGTALLGCLNDEYTRNAWGGRVVYSVCSEVFELFGADLLGVGSAEELADMVLQVASGTGRNKNSMLQDVLAGRPTEVDYLNGYVARVAAARGRAAPVNELLRTLIKAKETYQALLQSQ